jgi:hypothetical protein
LESRGDLLASLHQHRPRVHLRRHVVEQGGALTGRAPLPPPPIRDLGIVADRPIRGVHERVLFLRYLRSTSPDRGRTRSYIWQPLGPSSWTLFLAKPRDQMKICRSIEVDTFSCEARRPDENSSPTISRRRTTETRTDDRNARTKPRKHFSLYY